MPLCRSGPLWGGLATLCLVWGLICGLVGVSVAGPPTGQPPAVAAPAAPSAAAEESDSADTDTPRRALERFLSNTRAGNLAQAADDLAVSSGDVEESVQLARKLGAVLDRRLPFSDERLAKVSDLPSGSKADGMDDQEEVGRIEMPLGSEPVRLQRKRLPDGSTHWVFSLRTVQRVPAWYEQLADRWLLDHLPDALLVTGPAGILYWQWLALPLLILVSAIFGVVFSAVLRIVLRLIFFRRTLFMGVLDRQVGPLRLIGAALSVRLLFLSLFITAAAERTVRGVCNVVLIAGLIFGLWRIADVLANRVRQSAWLSARPGLAGMTPLLHRLLEVSLWALGMLWCLGELGYSITAVLASLGLGGLAVALAAKNTLEHLLGGMTLSLDQPMRVGDLVKIGDVQGHVEQIGIRSTRIRTQDRSLVTIPNGKLADLNIETLAARDRLRLQMSLNLNMQLKAPALRELRELLVARIKTQPLVSQDRVRVSFSGLNELAITAEIICWFETGDLDQFAESRHALLLALLEIVDEKNALALPPKK